MTAPVILEHAEARLAATPLQDGRHQLHLEPLGGNFAPVADWVTRYPMALVQLILESSGAWALDEIMREEDPRYVEHELRWEVLAFLAEGALDHARILDFGSGSGASTIILARLAPTAKILGIELSHEFVKVARARADFYGVSERVQFEVADDPTKLRDALGLFDFIMLSAVFEHLLPEERAQVMPQLWAHLKVDGMMFVHQTPHRWFPIEHHTTGLPLINYLPSGLVRLLATRLSNRVGSTDDWPTLLRRGIRGATVGSVLRTLGVRPDAARLAEPVRYGAKDRFDVWYGYSNSLRPTALRAVARWVFRAMFRVAGVTFVPYITLAIRKLA